MTRMIPPTIHPSTRSNAERRMFQIIRDVPDAEGWVCFHSLGLAHHPTKRQGEIDFLLLTRHGVFALEVKGGGIIHESRVWYSVNKSGRRYTLKESPFKQAADGMFEFERLLKRRFETKVLFGFGVAFPDIEFSAESPEWDQRVVYDSRDKAKPFTSYVNRLAQYHRDNEKRTQRPSLKLDAINAFEEYLRADFDFVPPTDLIIDSIRDQLNRLTLEQREVLDVLDTDERVIVRGAAGTGKTVLAIDAARRLATAGDRVLFVCYNKLLAARLAAHVGTKSYEGEIVVRNVDDHFVMVTKGTEFEPQIARAIEEDRQQAFAEVIPDYAALVASDRDDERFDVLIIDEAQDLLTTHKLDALNEMLRGGLESGRWCVFLDKDRQAQVYGHFEEEALARLTASGVRQPLSRNCRNTSEIAFQTALVSDAQHHAKTRINGDSVDFRVYRQSAGWLLDLQRVVTELRDDCVTPGRVSVLLINVPKDPVLKRLEKLGIRKLGTADIPNLGTAELDEITWQTVSSFKGLENDVIVLAGVEGLHKDWYRTMAYVGMSRARAKLYVLLDEDSDRKRRERERKWQQQRESELEMLL